MTMRLHFLPEVEEDVMAGYFWYEEKATGLGEEFLRVFYAEAGAIRAMPHRFTSVNREVRRCLLRRFPYAIYFKCETEEITVIGLFHCARDPIVIHDALANRLEQNS
jgi:hypothetical protein